MRKKIIAGLLSLCMIMGMFPNTMWADVFEDYQYRILEDGTAEITDYTGSAEEISIPDTVNGYSVTSIGTGAFWKRESLKNINIPDGVTTIGVQAFLGCTSLENISIPNSVTTIEKAAFCECESLKNISIPNGVTTIEDEVFWDCESLENISIPDSVTTISDSAFWDCESLKNISIPDSVTTIEWSTFSGCTSLEKIYISDNNEKYCDVDGVVFNKDRTSLIIYPAGRKDVIYEVPDGVMFIERSAFEDCTSLENISIPESVWLIGWYVFSGCTSLEKIYISDDNETYCDVDGVVFNKDITVLITYPEGRTNMNYMVPDSVTRIEDYAFSGCTSLESISIPDSVTGIGGAAFSGCTSLENISIPDSVTGIVDYAFKNCTSLENISIPDSVSVIWMGVFEGCTSLENISIPDGVTSIFDGAFSGCTSLSNVYFNGDAPKFYYCFPNVTATAYYPSDNPTWTADVLQDYGGTITWVPYEAGTQPEQNKEIDLITYLAMSDVSYKNRLSNYIGMGALGDIQNALYQLSLKDGKPKPIINANIPKSDGRTWEDIYKQCLSSWEVREVYDSGVSGLWAVVFEKESTDQIVITFRGSQALFTEEGNVDWFVDDAGMALLNEMTPQMSDAISFVNRVIGENPESDITLTGHSLGGGLAILTANAFNLQAYPFDSAPTLDVGYYRLWSVMGHSFHGIDKWTYTDHINEHCPVGFIEKGIKNYVSHEDLLAEGQSLVDVHDRYTIIDYKDSKFVISDTISEKTYSSSDIWEHSVNFIWGTLILGTSYGESGSNVSGKPGYIHTDVIYGGDGDDILVGYQGDDYLIGGAGNNVMDGNSGDDVYVYFKNQGIHTIYDYQGNDTLKLYGFNSKDSITFDISGDNNFYHVKCNEETIAKINKNRSNNPINSFVVEIFDGNEFRTSQKLQDWNQWKTIKTYKVACPVEINIYDPEGEKVLTVSDGSEDTIYTDYGNFYSVYNDVTDEYEKMVDLLEGYSIEIVGTDTGNMSVSVVETQEDGTEEIYSADGITVTEGKEFFIDDAEKAVVASDGLTKMELTEPQVAMTDFALNRGELKLHVGEESILNVATVLPEETTEIISEVIWDSSNPEIAIVEDGVVTGISEGEAWITASVINSTGEILQKSCLVTVTLTEMWFTDVNEADWFYNAVSYVNENGIMTGKSSTIFAPNESLARGQFASILHRMNAEPIVEFEPVFSDVEAGIWYTSPILWAREAGIVNGYADGRFGPGDMITREQMAIMMYNYANYLGFDTGARGDISKFKDADSVSWYAKEAVQWAVGAGIISGKDNGTILDPQGETARAQCAVIIQNFMEKYVS